MTSTADQPHIVLIATRPSYDVAALGPILRRYGLHVEAVSRGDEALALAARGNLALALLDVALAGSARMELCGRLIALCGGKLPVFLLSATAGEEERLRAREAGAAAYLPLSYNSDDMAEKILLQLALLRPAPRLPGTPTMASLQVNYHTMLAGSPDAILLLQRGSNRILDVNLSTRRMFGRTETELIQSDLLSLCAPAQPDGRTAAEAFEDYLKQVMAGVVRVFELTMRHSSGRAISCELRMVPLNTAEHRLMHVRIVDITGRKLAEDLRAGKNTVLEMIARGAPLRQTIERLILLIESQSDQVCCSVMLLSPDGAAIMGGYGPSMPPAYLDALEGLRIGPQAGSCGTAMFRRDTVVVSDIAHDPLWAPYRELAARYGLRACWSAPIVLDGRTVLGSFAMYYRDVRSPRDDELRLISTAHHLAGIAIASVRREAELQRHREHLEELVSARTAELRQAKEDAEHVNEELSTALDNLSMTQEELVRRDKLAALGALVAGVAHELNTPIGNSLVMASSMSERTATLRRDLEDGLRRSVLENYLEQAASADEVVLRNLTRAAALVASFKRIAVDSANAQRSRFVLGDLIAELLQSLQARMRQRGLRFAEDVEHWIELDSYPAALTQALCNLIENSMIHGFDGGGADPGAGTEDTRMETRIDTRMDAARGTISIAARQAGNGEIAITVSDDGAGIPAANLTRIYDPFFTTRLGSGGSGLGLYVTHNIVTGVLGGRIEAFSTEGRGASFALRVPRVAPL